MARTRAWRRYKNYTKAKRKRDIDVSVSWYPSFWLGYSDGEYVFPKRGMYKNLHQYSKNKIHCSCPWCSPRTRNKGRHRDTKNYAPSINYGMMDKRRQMAMDEDIKILEGNKNMKYVKFFISNGYSGCDYEEVECFDDDITDDIAKCHPNDTFDVEFGRKLAAARCNAKIAAKRVANAKNKYWETYNKLIEATKAHDKYSTYYIDAAEQHREAIVYLDEVRSSVYDA